MIAAQLVNPDHRDVEARAWAFLEAHGVQEHLDAGDVIDVAARFRQHLIETFEPSNIWVEWPISHRTENAQVARGWVDVLLVTDSGLVVIDHKSSPKPRTEWEQEALEHSGQLSACKQAIEATGKPVTGTWVHFPVSGGILEVAAASPTQIATDSLHWLLSDDR